MESGSCSSSLQQLKLKKPHNSLSSGTGSTPKTERKVIEKNRRNQMKILHSRLSSLLPHDFISKERDGRQFPEQVEEAANYIKSLQTTLEKLKDKKDKLLISSQKRPNESSALFENWANFSSMKYSFQVEINEMGPDLDIILVTGLNNRSMFYDTVRFLDEQVGEVVYANFSIVGPSIFHVVHKKIAAHEISKRLKELIDGPFHNQEQIIDSSCNQFYSDLELWDFEIHTDDIWNPAVFSSGNVGRWYM